MNNTASPDAVRYEWRGPFSNAELNTLHSEAFDHPLSDHDWTHQLAQHSVGWVTVRDVDTLAGFVNVAWDGSTHAFILDTAVLLQYRHRHIGVHLIELAMSGAADAGCTWLHVDYEPGLRQFYIDQCGFAPTAAGVSRLQ